MSGLSPIIDLGEYKLLSNRSLEAVIEAAVNKAQASSASQDGFMSMESACQYMEIKQPATIIKKIKEGKVPAKDVKLVGNDYRIRKTALEKLFSA